MKNKFIILLVILLSAMSCEVDKVDKTGKANKVNTGGKAIYLPIENKILACGIWKRTNIERSYENKKEEEYYEKNPIREHRDYYLNIFPDGRGTVMWDTEIDTIVWELVGGSEAIEDPYLFVQLPRVQWKVRLMQLDGDTTLEVSGNGGNTIMGFAKSANLTTNFREDPLHPDNNYWRIRAKRRLSDSEIEAKVDNYLQHYKYLFKAALDKENKRRFSSRNSMGILKVYKSAIGIVTKSKIDEDWYSYFDNKKEAIKAYNFLKEKIKSRKKKFKTTDNWIEDDYKILVEITKEENN